MVMEKVPRSDAEMRISLDGGFKKSLIFHDAARKQECVALSSLPRPQRDASRGSLMDSR